MGESIYGFDIDGVVTPLMVRDALSQCFYEAHCLDANIGEGESEVSKLYCKEIVKKAFSDSGGDFNHPTKDSIMGAINNIVEFSKNFRDPSIINKHKSEIMRLVEKMK